MEFKRMLSIVGLFLLLVAILPLWAYLIYKIWWIMLAALATVILLSSIAALLDPSKPQFPV